MKNSVPKTNKLGARQYNTKMSTIEKQYGVSFEVSPEKTLGAFLKEKGYPSLSEMLKKA